MKIGTDRRIRASPCLHCGRQLSGATAVGDDAAPTPGDATVCIYCGHIMVFAEDLKLRNPIAAEIDDLAGDERILTVQRARKAREAPLSDYSCPGGGRGPDFREKRLDGVLWPGVPRFT